MKKLLYLSLAVFFLFAASGAFAESGKVEGTKADKTVDTKKTDDTKKADMIKYEKRKADNPEIIINGVSSVNKRLVWFEESYHILTWDVEKDEVARTIIEFFDTL